MSQVWIRLEMARHWTNYFIMVIILFCFLDERDECRMKPGNCPFFLHPHQSSPSFKTLILFSLFLLPCSFFSIVNCYFFFPSFNIKCFFYDKWIGCLMYPRSPQIRLTLIPFSLSWTEVTRDFKHGVYDRKGKQPKLNLHEGCPCT